MNLQDLVLLKLLDTDLKKSYLKKTRMRIGSELRDSFKKDNIECLSITEKKI